MNKIKDLLIGQGYVDNFYCIDHRITTRLSSAIERLRKQGWEIETDMHENKNCYYHLKQKPLI
jgi:hypothetical protein